MRSIAICSTILAFAVLALLLAGLDVGHAGVACSGILDGHQQEAFKKMFTPPYAGRLTKLPGPVRETENIVAKLDAPILKQLQVKTPIVAVTATLTESRADTLKGWLNANASATLPGWLSTVVGIAAPSAWVGLAADAFLQLINAQGDLGRLKVANIAGTVSADGLVGVLEQASKDKAGNLKFLAVYVYQYELNKKRLTTPLVICSADVVQ